jgi:hypothetical protein
MRPSLGHCFLESADETVDSFVPPESHDVARDAVDGRNPFVRFGARFQPQPLSLAEVSGKLLDSPNGFLDFAPLG